METGIINQAIQKLCIAEGKEVNEVIQYLKLKYRIDIDPLVLQKRIDKLMNKGKAVA
ncbi:hypothetical protein [Algoriphagus algorifonticola]|uniref:hypothetical protein n=1 Tax=Algoriphagus algorifonticola TaxID=2593007 RepID=UPI001642CDA8|nr:hypothetical protein [Algoriphagus algorifonticola]